MTANPSGGPALAAARLRAALHSYPLMAAATVLFIASRFLQPFYTDNESVYALGSIKLLHPSFLPTHPFLDRFNPFFWVYDAATAPLYLVLNWLAATLVVRAAIWGLQVWALSRLFRVLGLPAWSLLVTAVLWLNVEQTLVAGELVVGAAAGKPLAYGFLFLGLSYAAEGRWRQAGLWGGVATGCHVLVGGWGALALGVASLFSGPLGEARRRVWAFSLPAGVIGLVALAPALWAMATGPVAAEPAAAAEADRLYVLWATPFHLDPDFFMTGLEWLKVPLYVLATLGLLTGLLPRGRMRPVLVFLIALALCFGAGLIARRLELFAFLKYYPFRVADGMYPLFFWMGVSSGLVVLARKAGRHAWWAVALAIPLLAGAAKRLNNVLEPAEHRNARLSSLAGALTHGEPRMSAYAVRERAREWRRALSVKPTDPLLAMEYWIRANTPREAVFVIPPWEYSFTLNAHRAEFISFKTFTVRRMREWRDRLEALRGAPLQGRGWDIVRELRDAYPEIPAERLRALTSAYRADYFLTTSALAYDFPLAHSEGAWRLYRLPAGNQSGATTPSFAMRTLPR